MVRGIVVLLLVLSSLGVHGAYFKGHEYSGDIKVEGDSLLIMSQGVVDGVLIRVPAVVEFGSGSADVIIKGRTFVASTNIDAQFLPENPFITVSDNQHLRIYGKFHIEQEKIFSEEITLENGMYLVIETGAFSVIGKKESVPLNIETFSQRISFDEKQNFKMQPVYEKEIGQGEIVHRVRESISIPEFKDTGYALNKWNDYLGRLPPALKASIQDLRLVPSTEIEKACGEHAGGCSFEDVIILSDDAEFQTLTHEAAHTYVYALEKQEVLPSDAYRNLIKTRAQLRKKYGMDTTMITAKDKLILQKAEQTYADENAHSFKENWKEIAGNVYAKDMASKHIGGKHARTWANGSDGPRFGCVSAYGCNNIDEDIATFVEEIGNNESALQSLKNAPDRRYRKKIELLSEYGFFR